MCSAQTGRNGTFWLVPASCAEASDRSVKDKYGPRDSRVIAAVRSDWLALVCARHALAV